MAWTRSTTCQAPRLRSQAVASALYSFTSSATWPGSGSGHGVVDARALDPQRGAGAGGAGADLHAADASQQGARVAVGQPADLLDRAEDAGPGVGAVDARDEEDRGLPGSDLAAAWAASTAARTSASLRSRGTTIPGRTTSSSSGSTGRVSGVKASDSAAMISPSAVKLSYIDSMKGSPRLFPRTCSL